MRWDSDLIQHSALALAFWLPLVIVSVPVYVYIVHLTVEIRSTYIQLFLPRRHHILSTCKQSKHNFLRSLNFRAASFP